MKYKNGIPDRRPTFKEAFESLKTLALMFGIIAGVVFIYMLLLANK